jgi:hypothetical protein
MSKPLVRFVPTGSGFHLSADRKLLAELAWDPMDIPGVRYVDKSPVIVEGWKIWVMLGHIEKTAVACMQELEGTFTVVLCPPGRPEATESMELSAWAKISEQLLNKL